eukprot:gb/GECH01011553.1/.p1 GENE.gb/GECH01011553.1/~~gb/GECH01011553.1/.p1  ORF type:complete len:593 (+),score=144.08 gb/GECH01011553.1/:1-1779(+)
MGSGISSKKNIHSIHKGCVVSCRVNEMWKAVQHEKVALAILYGKDSVGESAGSSRGLQCSIPIPRTKDVRLRVTYKAEAYNRIAFEVQNVKDTEFKFHEIVITLEPVNTKDATFFKVEVNFALSKSRTADSEMKLEDYLEEYDSVLQNAVKEMEQRLSDKEVDALFQDLYPQEHSKNSQPQEHPESSQEGHDNKENGEEKDAKESPEEEHAEHASNNENEDRDDKKEEQQDESKEENKEENETEEKENEDKENEDKKMCQEPVDCNFSMWFKKSATDDVMITVPGGSGANTMKGLACLGESVGVMGKIGTDFLGNQYTEALSKRGVYCVSSDTDSMPTGQVVCLVTPDGQRTMRAFLGASDMLSESDLLPQDLENVKLLHMEGYSLYNGTLTMRAMDAAKKAGAKISFTLSSFEVIRRFEKSLINLIKKYVDIVFCNEDEAAELTRGGAPEKTVDYLATLADIAVVTMGQKGCWVKQKNEKYCVPVDPVTPRDTTGAGDLFASGFLHGYLQGFSNEQCAMLGNVVGAAAVEVLGAEITMQDWARINRVFKTSTTVSYSSIPTSSPAINRKYVPKRAKSLPIRIPSRNSSSSL